MSGHGSENHVGLLASSDGDTGLPGWGNRVSGHGHLWCSWRRRASLAIRWIAGSVLIVAALTKLITASPTASLATVLFGVHGDLLWGLVETSVGAWLIAGWYVPVALRVALVLFGAFVGVNGVLAWLGWPSCGCFGAVPIGPLTMLGMDAGLVGLLLCACRWSSQGELVSGENQPALAECAAHDQASQP
jgi:hypothetical protein